MKTLLKMCTVFCLLLVVSSCKNPLTRFTSQYNCTIPGKPDPQTSADFVTRAKEHIEMNSQDMGGAYDDCSISALNEAIRLDSKNAEAYVIRSLALLFKKNYEAASADVERSVQLDPSDPSVYDLSRLDIHEDEDLDKVIKYMSKIIEITPKNDEKTLAGNYYQRGNIYKRKEDYKKALDDLTKAIELTSKNDSKWSPYYAFRGSIYQIKKDYERAVQDFTEVIKIDPRDNNGYLLRATVYREMGKTDLAIADELKSAELNSSKTTQDANKTETTESVIN